MHQLTTKSDTLINQVQFVLIQTSTSIMKHVCFSVTFCLKTRPTLYRIKYDCFFNNVQIDKMKKCEDRAKPPIYPFLKPILAVKGQEVRYNQDQQSHTHIHIHSLFRPVNFISTSLDRGRNDREGEHANEST